MSTPNSSRNVTGPQPDHTSFVFRDQVYMNQIGGRFHAPQQAIDYLRHSYFRDPASVLDQAHMQSRFNQLSADQLNLSQLTGSTYRVAWSDLHSQCFHIAKDWQHGADGKYTPMAVYVVNKDSIQQAPDLYSLISARLTNGLNHLHKSFVQLNQLVHFTPAQGFQWHQPPLDRNIPMPSTDTESVVDPAQRDQPASIKSRSKPSTKKSSASNIDNAPINPLHALKTQVFSAQVHTALMRAAAREHITLSEVSEEPEDNGMAGVDPIPHPVNLSARGRSNKKSRKDRDSDSLGGDTRATKKRKKPPTAHSNDTTGAKSSRASSITSVMDPGI